MGEAGVVPQDNDINGYLLPDEEGWGEGGGIGRG